MVSWRDFYQHYEGGEYLLFDSSAGRASAVAHSPSPFFKAGVEWILREFDKPAGERDASAIAAGAAMLDRQMLSTLSRLPDDTSRLKLLAAYDPRFGRLNDDIARDLLAHLLVIAARESSGPGGRRTPGGRRSRRGQKLAAYFELHPEAAGAVCGARGRQGAATVRKVIESAGVRTFGDRRDKAVLAVCRRAAAAVVKKSRA